MASGLCSGTSRAVFSCSTEKRYAANICTYHRNAACQCFQYRNRHIIGQTWVKHNVAAVRSRAAMPSLSKRPVNVTAPASPSVTVSVRESFFTLRARARQSQPCRGKYPSDNTEGVQRRGVVINRLQIACNYNMGRGRAKVSCRAGSHSGLETAQVDDFGHHANEGATRVK